MCSAIEDTGDTGNRSVPYYLFSELSVADLSLHHFNCDIFPNVLLNCGLPSPEMLQRYGAEHARVVEVDRDRLRAMGLNFVERDLLAEDGKVRHDPDRLARAVFEMAGL